MTEPSTQHPAPSTRAVIQALVSLGMVEAAARELVERYGEGPVAYWAARATGERSPCAWMVSRLKRDLLTGVRRLKEDVEEIEEAQEQIRAGGGR
jgi:hypothetical protein